VVGKLSYANVMSTIAVFLALAGGSFAVAAALQNNSVKSKHVKDGALQQRDLKEDEAAHVIGQPGQPVFGAGGDNDCIWGAVDGPSPAGFYMDKLGRVHFQGVLAGSDGPSGDAACDATTAAEQFQDGTAFVLPPAYRPDSFHQLPAFGGGQDVIVLVGADEDTDVGPQTVPAGSVVLVDVEAPTDVPGPTTIDGISFRASTSAPARRRSGDAGSALRAVLGR
jgi:hypothetical protein